MNGNQRVGYNSNVGLAEELNKVTLSKERLLHLAFVDVRSLLGFLEEHGSRDA